MRRWFISRRGEVHGPLSFESLQALANAGQLQTTDHVCPEGADRWVRAGDVANLFGSRGAIPEGKLEGAAATPQRAAQPVRVAAERPAAAATKAVPSRGVPAGAVWDKWLLALPKPLLFGLFGGVGGLLGAMLVAEVIWAIFSPPEYEAAKPKIEIVVPSSMKIYAGGKNWFNVKVARRGFTGPLRIAAAGGSGLAVFTEVFEDGQVEGDILVQADKSAALGKRQLNIVASSSAAEGVEPMRVSMDVNVVAPQEQILRLTVSPEVSVLQGGTNKFTIKLSRPQPQDKVQLYFENVPRGVTLPTIDVPPGASELELEVAAARNAASGFSKVLVKALAVDQPQVAGGSADFRLEVIAVAPSPRLDILFVLDLTGSMDFAIQGIKDGVLDFAKKMREMGIDFRVGLIGFRDIEDDQELPFPLLVDGQTFTKNVEAFRDQVGQLKAFGGGDEPESVMQGLVLAGKQDFREGVDRVLVLITDAPPKVHKRPGKVAYPPFSIAETAQELKKYDINQIHLIVRKVDFDNYYKELQKGLKGTFYDIHEHERGNFAGLLPKLGSEISVITAPTKPAAPKVTVAPQLPEAAAGELPRAASDSTLKAVQAVQVFASADSLQLLLSIALWTMVIASAISVAILAGQRYYTRRRWYVGQISGTALAGGLIAGAIGGCVGQVLFQLTSGFAGGEVASRVAGWTVLGALIGGGLTPFVPNLKWNRGLLGGVLGGCLGSLAFVAVSQAAGPIFGRWLGAGILGFCIGLMVALVELAFRRWWLEVRFGPHEVRTFTLGLAAVSIGSSEKRATVFIAGVPPLALRYWINGDRAFCKVVEDDETKEVRAGDCQSLGKATVTVCSSATARQSGYRLRLSTGVNIVLGEGMPLTAEDLPGLDPQGADGIVALANRRPNDRRVLLLRNRSRQSWSAREANGAVRTVEPGLAIEIADGLQINFGQVQGRAVEG